MFNILCRLFSRNTQILAQSKRTDSIHNTEINRFCISPLQICHFIKWYMEYLGSCHSVNIARLTVCLDQLFVTGTMRQNTKLDLRIIRIYKDAAFFWYKYFTDQTSKLHTNRYILQIRFCTADTSGCCDRLIEFTVNSSIHPYIICKSVCIC